MNDPARQDLLLAELERDLGWRRGEAVPVTLVLAPDAAGRLDLSVGFAAAANLLSRMVGTVSALGLVADVPVTRPLSALMPHVDTLDEAAARLGQAAGLLPVCIGALDTGITVGVGHVGTADLWFDADGWLALIGLAEPGKAATGAPVGAIVGSCLIANELFTLVHGSHPRRRAFRLSAWDGGSVPGPMVDLTSLTLGPFDLAGAGAVAQTALWTLAASGIRAEVWCADDDVVAHSNLERLPFCGQLDIGAPKVAVLAQALASSAITFSGQVSRFEVARREVAVPLLSAVDDDRAREALQQIAPPLLLSATTGGLAVTVEWHDLDPRFACLSCGHPVQSGPSIKELAARLGIPAAELRGSFTCERLASIEERHGLDQGALAALKGRDVCGHLNEVARRALGIGGPSGSISFLSWYAGALLAVELIAHRTGHEGGRPRMRLLTLAQPARLTTRSRRPRATCSCQSTFFASYYAERRAAKALTGEPAGQDASGLAGSRTSARARGSERADPGSVEGGLRQGGER